MGCATSKEQQDVVQSTRSLGPRAPSVVEDDEDCNLTPRVSISITRPPPPPAVPTGETPARLAAQQMQKCASSAFVMCDFDANASGEVCAGIAMQ